MRDRIPYTSKEQAEGFKKTCALIAQKFWDGESETSVYAFARDQFSSAPPKYVGELLGTTPEAHFRFVREWIGEQVASELSQSGIGEADAFAYYTHRRTRMQESRALEN